MRISLICPQHSGVNKLNTAKPACTLYQDVDLISVAYKSNGSITEVYFFGIKKKESFLLSFMISATFKGGDKSTLLV